MEWSDGAKGFVTAGGKRLEAQCFGPSPAEAPTIVLLHEGLGCLALWRDFPQALAEATGWGVFVYSRAGYGQSDLDALPRPLDYMTREAVEVLPEVLDAFGFQRGVLMGHSDGATIAAIYAGSVSDHRVRGLVLMAPHFFTEEMGLRQIAAAREVFASGDMRAKMAKYHRDPEHTFKGWNDAWLDPGFKAWNVGDVIDYLRIPVLAVQGRDDEYGTLAQIEEVETRCYAPVDTLILDDCRHAPQMDQPRAVLDGVTEFVTRLDRIERAGPEAA
ncbi:alpha/beta fold hydrolase [Antarctobacter jejuensis]|uniref:alpha/beta fold hydrolase n=1 Tax=Antarctobacter jejuensis TaxID=1439938 RepID=UPI003FD33F06